MNIACAVLAAGASTRLGFPKQLLPWFGHTNLVQHAVDCAHGSHATRVGVVVGAHAANVQRTLRGRDVEFVYSAWRLGLSASVRAAARWADTGHAQALLLVLCDQPYLSPEHLARLLTSSRDGTYLAASRYAGRAAAPALFPARYFPALSKLEGDQGAGQLLNHASSAVLVDWPDGEVDIDTPSDIVTATESQRPQYDHGPMSK